MKNIILTGMPGAGKSTIGVLLAKTLGMGFFDTDILIQEQCGMLLQDIIDSKGIDKFLNLEEKLIMNMNSEEAVIATGGSVVYSEKAMDTLKNNGYVFYLEVTLDEIKKRVSNIKTRGIVSGKGKSLSDIYNERIPLYKKYADVTINCTDKNVEQVIDSIIVSLQEAKYQTYKNCKSKQNVNDIIKGNKPENVSKPKDTSIPHPEGPT